MIGVVLGVGDGLGGGWLGLRQSGARAALTETYSNFFLISDLPRRHFLGLVWLPTGRLLDRRVVLITNKDRHVYRLCTGWFPFVPLTFPGGVIDHSAKELGTADKRCLRTVKDVGGNFINMARGEISSHNYATGNQPTYAWIS